MFKDRRLWFLAPVVLALLMLLGFARGRGGASAPAEPVNVDSTVTGTADASPDPASSPTTAADDEQPRHPQIGFRTSDRLREHFRKHGR